MRDNTRPFKEVYHKTPHYARYVMTRTSGDKTADTLRVHFGGVIGNNVGNVDNGGVLVRLLVV